MSAAPLSPLELSALFLALVCGAGLINRRFLGLPPGAAMLVTGLIAALGARAVFAVRPDLFAFTALLDGLDFKGALLGYMLAFLLFAGAFSVDFRVLRKMGLEVIGLSTLGVAASTLLVGFGLQAASNLIGQPIGSGPAFVFAALISPTDPVAVLATVRGGVLSPRLKALLQGEALFNDGVGIVAFRTAFALVFTHTLAPSFPAAAGLFLLSGLGGLAVGVACGLVTSRLLRLLDDAPLAMAATLACAGSSYALAERCGVSGALAAAAAGLVVGAAGVRSADRGAAQALSAFWTLTDELLNALLFLMLGLEALRIPFDAAIAALSAIAFALTLAARLITVGPLGLRFVRGGERGALTLLTLGGLRGGLSLALALSLPLTREGGRLISLTYGVVALSVLVQGLAFSPLSRLFASSTKKD